MRKIGSTSTGSVIVEMTESDFAHCEKSLSSAKALKRMTHDERVNFARGRLKKLDPKSKAAAIHSIEAMFQFHGGVTTEEAEQVYAALKK